MNEPNLFVSFIPFLAVIAIFYFIMIRPQQKKQKERNAMLQSLKKGDKVITIGGVHGTITDITEERVTLKVSDTTKLLFERSAVNAVKDDEN